MKPAIITRIIVFVLAGCSITNFYIYYFGNWYVNVPSWWPLLVLLIGVPCGVFLAGLPWGRHIWKGYVLSSWLLLIHVTFLIRNHSFDLKDMNYTSVLNFQFLYNLPLYIMAFFFFQPWKWGEKEKNTDNTLPALDSDSNSAEVRL